MHKYSLHLYSNKEIETNNMKNMSSTIIKQNSKKNENFYKVLFILQVLYKKNIVNSEITELQSYDLKNYIKSSVLKTKNPDLNDAFSVYENYFNIIEDKDLEVAVKVIQSFLNIDKDPVKSTLLEVSKQNFVNNILPYEVSKLVNYLCNSIKDAKIYNPFSGLASFALELHDSNIYHGQEINELVWATSYFRLLQLDKIKNNQLFMGNSIKNWNPLNEKYDLILSNPPFTLKVSNNKYDNFYDFLINEGLKTLKENGKMLLLLPQSFLFKNDKTKKIREDLIHKDLLETVITLPSNILYNTAVNTCLVLINKKKSKANDFRFIDAQNCFKQTKNNHFKLDLKAIKKELESHKSSEFQKIATVDEINKNDFILIPKRYLTSYNEGVPLEELCSIVQKVKTHVNNNLKIVEINDLKSSSINNTLNLNDLKTSDSKLKGQLIEESCILMNTMGKQLYSTYFQYQEEKIFISNGIIALKIDEKKCDPNYLMQELTSNYVKIQFSKYNVGSVIQHIRNSDVLKLRIKMPFSHDKGQFDESLKVQKAKIAGFMEAQIRMELEQVKQNAALHGLENIMEENFAQIKHALGKPLLNITAALKNIESALNNANVDWKGIKLSRNSTLNIEDTFNSIQSNLQLIHNVLKKGEREFEPSSYKLKEINFLKFIKKYIKNQQANKPNNVEIDLFINDDFDEFLKNEVLINGNIDLLKIAFNNIIQNAIDHSFVDHNQKYKLQFKLNILLPKTLPIYHKTKSKSKVAGTSIFPQNSKLAVQIEICNNGKAFPTNFNLEKLKRKNAFAGETGNTGFGGYQLNEIVKYLSGNLDLDLKSEMDNSEFKTNYIIKLPIIE